MKFADLHIHTNFSDGVLTPKEVVELSVKNGLSCISITDHDTLDAIEPTLRQARLRDLEVITGIEMSSELDNRELHILGYFINQRSKDLLDKLSSLKQIRIERIYKMVEKLHSLGLKDIDAEEVIELSGRGTVGRAHLAMIMKKKGYVDSISEAFFKLIGDKGPAYVGRFRFHPKEAIDLIHKAGGISVVAHPHSLINEGLIDKFVGYGLKGIEVYYPDYTKSQIEHYTELANKFGLLITGGSDSHGSIKKNTFIGKVKIPYELVEQLKKAKTIE